VDVLDDLVEIGVDVFNPIQPETMDVREVIGTYAGRLSFYGGLSIQRTLPFGTPAEVMEEVESRIGLARKHGGYIVAPSHDMPPDIPLENVDAMLDVLFNQ
jgi:uroporphyrinogen decarboxylase